MKKSLLIILGLCVLAYSGAALTENVSINVSLTNLSSSYTCNATINNTLNYSYQLSISVSASTTGLINYNYTNCSNASTNELTYTGSLTALCGQTLYCFGQIQNCAMEDNISSQLAYSNVTGNCTTTTSTSTSISTSTTLVTSLTTIPYGTDVIPSMNGSVSPMANNTALGTTILGLSRTNFFYIISLFLITIITISVSSKSLKAGPISGVAAADYLSLVLGWMPITATLLIAINFIAFIYFIGGLNK